MEEILNPILEELQRRQQNNETMRQLRDASNPFTLPHELFRKMYRLTNHVAHEVFLEIQPFLDNGLRRTRIPPVVQFIVSLHFYAHGSYQKSIGKDRHCSMSQASISRSLRNVANVIMNNLAARCIKFPQRIDEIIAVKNRFHELFQFPGVIGVIDGTHVAIFPPAFGRIPPRAVYLNRKNYYSINCQIICDANLKILNINPRYPGSVHDSAIWRMSNIFELLNNRYRNGERTTWLLGDSGYPLQPFLLTPVRGAEPNTPEGRYTSAHIRSRNTVERCIGVLKGNFRCLLKDRTLHYAPEVAANIIIACATLYNILRMRNIDNDVYEEDDDIENYDEDDEVHNNLLAAGVVTRNAVINNHFIL